MKKKHILLKTVFVVMSLMLFTSCQKSGGSKGELTVVNIGTQRIPNGEKIAIDKKYFEEEFGVAVNIIEFNAGDIRNALVSKDIDFAHLGVSSGVLGIASGIEAEVIWIHEVLGEAERLVVKKGSGIESIHDLVGKNVATAFSTTTHYSLLKAMELNGIAEKDVTLYDMQMVVILGAWEGGVFGAAYAWEPTLSSLLEDGNVLLTSKELAEQGIVTSNVEIVRTEFAKNHPEIVIGYIKAVDKAVKLYKEDHSAAIKSLSDQLNISAEEAIAQSSGSVWLRANEQLDSAYFGTSDQKGDLPNSLKDIADFLYEQKSLAKEAELSVFEEAVNPMYIEEALK